MEEGKTMFKKKMEKWWENKGDGKEREWKEVKGEYRKY